MNTLKIHDIKNLEVIPDYSLYLFILLLALGAVLVCFLLYILVKKILLKKQNIKKIYFENLKNLDLENTKKSAYEITKYGQYFCEEKRVKKLYFELNESLEKYKYKKEVEKFDTKTKEEIRRFMDAIDV